MKLVDMKFSNDYQIACNEFVDLEVEMDELSVEEMDIKKFNENNKWWRVWALAFTVENDDINEVFGVYINDGILSESCSEAVITNQ